MLGGVLQLFLEGVDLLLAGMDHGCQGLHPRFPPPNRGLDFGWSLGPELWREDGMCFHSPRVRQAGF